MVFRGENDVFHAGKRSKFCLDVGLKQFRNIVAQVLKPIHSFQFIGGLLGYGRKTQEQEEEYIFHIVKRGQERKSIALIFINSLYHLP